MDDGPHVAILLMCVSRNTRRVDFRGLKGSKRTPQFWGVTGLNEIELKNSSLVNISMEFPLILCFCIRMVDFGMGSWTFTYGLGM